jgi:hypothetical protein
MKEGGEVKVMENKRFSSPLLHRLSDITSSPSPSSK